MFLPQLIGNWWELVENNNVTLNYITTELYFSPHLGRISKLTFESNIDSVEVNECADEVLSLI